MEKWKRFADTYDPLKAGSIDGTDAEPHDHAVFRAMEANYLPPSNLDTDPSCTVFVGRVAQTVSEDELRALFKSFGRIRSFRLVRDIITGFPRGYAFVEYEDPNGAKKAFREGNRQRLDGKEIVVEFESARTMPGWIPRRLGGGFGGRKESGQLRFGGRDRPFRKPVALQVQDLKGSEQRYRQRDYEKSVEPRNRSPSTSAKSQARDSDRNMLSYGKDRWASGVRDSASRLGELKARRSRSRERRRSLTREREWRKSRSRSRSADPYREKNTTNHKVQSSSDHKSDRSSAKGSKAEEHCAKSMLYASDKPRTKERGRRTSRSRSRSTDHNREDETNRKVDSLVSKSADQKSEKLSAKSTPDGHRTRNIRGDRSPSSSSSEKKGRKKPRRSRSRNPSAEYRTSKRDHVYTIDRHRRNRSSSYSSTEKSSSKHRRRSRSRNINSQSHSRSGQLTQEGEEGHESEILNPISKKKGDKKEKRRKLKRRSRSKEKKKKKKEMKRSDSSD